MSNMNTRVHNLSQGGEINVLLIPLILVVLLLFGAVGFGYWAYSGQQDYKNNTDQKITAAVAVANQQLTAKLQQQFNQAAKNPLKTYNGPESFGTIRLQYPKTWSAYVAEDDSSDTPVDGYFYPGVVPDTSGDNPVPFALRVQVVQQTYGTTLQDYQSQAQGGQVTVHPYKFPKVPNVVGSRVTGQIEPQTQGDMVILPLRNETLQVWTEASGFESDFKNIILPNFTFSP